MTIPRRFFLGMIPGFLLAVIVFVGLLYTQLGVPTASSQWIFSLYQKKDLLAAKAQGSRLLVVAGSSGLFGINAQLIQQETGCPAINMSTHAGLGPEYVLYRVEEIARPGDTVLLALEYEHYSRLWSDLSDDFILAHDPQFFHRIPFFEKIKIATRIPFQRLQQGWSPRHISEQINLPFHSPYSPITSDVDCLDENGDEIFNPQAAQPSPSADMRAPIAAFTNETLSATSGGFVVLTQFIKWARTHQITVFATFPNIVYLPDYDRPDIQKRIATITQFYDSEHVPIIGTAREAMLPLNQFFDTKYHLTHEAALKRTQRLVSKLRPYLPRSK
jgi:hypothetical protein